MHDVSALFTQIFNDPGHWDEVMLNIAGQEYTQANIVSVSISGGLFDTPGIGNCASRQIDMEIIPIGTLPRQAQIQVFSRVCVDDQQSEWIPKGVFFFSTRETDSTSGVMTVTGYDAMLKAEDVWLNEDYVYDNWPMPQSVAVNDIAARMGVELDGRTVLSEQFPVEYPVDEDGDLYMREALSYIAVSNAGNWIITDEGKLRLVRFGTLPEITRVLGTETGATILLGGVKILV